MKIEEKVVIKNKTSHRMKHTPRRLAWVCENEKGGEDMEQAFPLEKIFPMKIREAFSGREWQEGLEEIRVRIGQPMEFVYDSKNQYPSIEGGACTFVEGCFAGKENHELYRMTMQDISEMLSYISNYSLYAYKEEMKQGYITIEGGHRIGLAGGAVMEQGKIMGLHHVAFLNIRVAHQKQGCATEVLSYIRQKNSIYNTLLLSEPGAGKTTLLRDCIRQLSDGDCAKQGMKVAVLDERSEIAACHLGIPQNDLGMRTDVLDGCDKTEGMRMLLRTMSPQIIAVDELGAEADFMAVEQAVYSGCKVLGTIHAGDVRELFEKPYLSEWVKREVFQRYIWIKREADGNRKTMVYDARMERLC